jgi:hypothetical protein
MRFMAFVVLSGQALADYENGRMPTEDEMSSMMAFNEELVQAGVMTAGDGLAPTADAARIDYQGGQSSVTLGPFTEAAELIGGYWIWNVASRDEAVTWARKCPMGDGDAIILRRIFDMEDFAVDPGSELAQQIERVDAGMAES